MLERFTDRGRNVVVLAQDEARALNHNHIGTEHLLLGLLREEEGLAARVLDTFDITLTEMRAQVARIVGEGTETVGGPIPFTPRAKKVLELGLQESLALGLTVIGTEHILLGLVRENEGVAARVLHDFGVDAEQIRTGIMGMLSGPGRPKPASRFQRVLIACPSCGHRLETVTADRPGTSLDVSAECDRTCPGCGKRWAIAYSVTWRETPG